MISLCVYVISVKSCQNTAALVAISLLICTLITLIKGFKNSDQAHENTVLIVAEIR